MAYLFLPPERERFEELVDVVCARCPNVARVECILWRYVAENRSARPRTHHDDLFLFAGLIDWLRRGGSGIHTRHSGLRRGFRSQGWWRRFGLRLRLS